MKSLDIIGAGIGGLTTAIALEKEGIACRIFEQAPEMKPVGAGIILADNAKRVYEKLGMLEEIVEEGNKINLLNITDAQLVPLSSINLKTKNQLPSTAIHRGKLQSILLEQIPAERLYLDHKLEELREEGEGFSLSFSNGKTVQSTCLLGADGIHSQVRESLFEGTEIRDAGQICWRGVANYELPFKFRGELNEAWGKGDRFGFVQIDPERVYWYALRNEEEGSAEKSKEELVAIYASYHPIVSEIIVASEKIHTASISDLKPTKKWYKKNVCLLGDAAHATTPNLGQGACQSIEDAYVLSRCLGKFDTNMAFAEFVKLRRSEAHRIVNMSWRLGKVAHWENSAAIKIRNLFMRMTPVQ